MRNKLVILGLAAFVVWAAAPHAQRALDAPATAATTCDGGDAVGWVEAAFYHAVSLNQPGLEYDKPGTWRAIEMHDRDPLRGATRIGDCDYRVRSFVTAGGQTIRYTARATMRGGKWQVGELAVQ